MITRILLALLFCVIGFVAPLEPMPARTQWIWRGIYGLIFVGNIAGLAHLIRGIRPR